MSYDDDTFVPGIEDQVINQPRLADPTFADDAKYAIIIMGGNELSYDLSSLENGLPLPHVGFGEKLLPVFVRVRNGKLYADMTLYNLSCEPVMTLKDNNIALKHANWDRNMSEHALEVVDDQERPMFQLIYERPAKLKINGVFCTSHYIVYSDDHMLGGTRRGLPLPSSFQLKRIFRYPSWKYPGELEQQ